MRETVGEPYTGNPYVRFDEGLLMEGEPRTIRGSHVRRNVSILAASFISSLLYMVVEEKKEGQGTREFIRVLRLLKDYPMAKLRKAVEKGLEIRGHSRDVIAQFLIPRFSWEQTTFMLANRQHLRLVKVARPDITAYRELLCKGGAS